MCTSQLHRRWLSILTEAGHVGRMTKAEARGTPSGDDQSPQSKFPALGRCSESDGAGHADREESL
jgi:hypothetical protein